MKKLLITGFDPFGANAVNPAWEAVKALPDVIGDFKLCKLNIPTVFEAAAQVVLAEAERLAPDVILSIGLAAGRESVTPERIAVNIRDARICDNAGHKPQGTPVIAKGPAAYFATVPVAQMRDAILAAGLPAAVSNSAGTFVCNDVLYTLLHRYHNTETQVGFIHVPQLPEQGSPSLRLEETVAALTAAIGALS